MQEAARLAGRTTEEIAAWESDESDESPTYAQLEKLAYKVYRRPLAAFFLPEPPTEPTVEQQFRTLPEVEIEHLSPETRHHLRLARAFQLSLEELTGGANPADRKIFREVQLTIRSRVQSAADQIRSVLDVSLDQQRSWASVEEALKNWRTAVEQYGVFVFKNSLERDVSGFSLAHEEFPVIYLNNSTPKARQIFSLFHELCHVLTSTNSISLIDQSYVDELGDAERALEQFCNAVTAALLVPQADFSTQLAGRREFGDEVIEQLAARYLVSREVVLRRLLDLGLVGQDYYRRKVQEWADAQGPPPRPGGNYYATQATYLGQAYMQLVFRSYYQGRIGFEQVADYLGVKTKSVAGLEALLLARAS